MLGADAIRKMDSWYRPRAVPSLCNICILNRAGERVDIPSVLAEMNVTNGGLLDNLSSGHDQAADADLFFHRLWCAAL